MADDNDDEAAAKQLKVEEKVRSDADFMAAIDAQMEALSRRRRGRKAVDVPFEKEQPPEPDNGQSISVRADKLTDEIPKPEPPAGPDPSAEMHLSHTAPDVVPINLTKRSINPEAVPGHDVLPSDRPKAADAAGAAQRIDVTRTQPVYPPQAPSLSGIHPKPEPAVVESESPPETIQTPVSDDQAEAAIAVPALNTAKLDSQVRRDPDLETISADIPEELPVETTTKYHLPIKQGHIKHHHPPVNTLVAVGLFLLLGLFIVVIAIDMELIDPGFNLPFDFFHGA